MYRLWTFFKGLVWRLIVFCLVLAVCGVAVAFVLTHVYFTFNHVSITNDSTYRSDDGFLYCTSDVEEGYRTRFYDVIEKLDSNVQSTLKTRWIFVIMSSVPADREDYLQAYLEANDTTELDCSLYEVAGVTNTEDKIVYLYINEAFQEHFDEILVHEIGHVVSYEIGYADQQDGFCDLYNTHKASYLFAAAAANRDYNIMNSAEFFASVFTDYVLYDDHLEAEAPELYRYFDNALAVVPGTDGRKKCEAALKGYWTQLMLRRNKEFWG